ncbi:MAG: hypothetical protein ACXIVL_03640 [Oceanicaulis sp.]
MTNRLSLIAGLVALCASAAAQAQLPPPLEAALSATLSERAPARMAMRWTVEGESVTYEVLPAEGGPPAYRLLEPEEAALSERQREIWTSVTRERSSDDEGEADAPRARVTVGTVDYSGLRASIGEQATLDRTLPDGELVYSFAPRAVPGGNDTPDAMLRALRGEVIIDPRRGELKGFHLFAPDSFKPSIAARIERFSLRQDFVHDAVLGGPRFAALEMDMAGSAAFQRFDRNLIIEIISVEWRDGEDAAETLGPAADSP